MQGRKMLAGALSLALACASAASAAGRLAPQDSAAIKSYVLTVDKVNRYTAASAALKRDTARNPALKAEADRADDETAPTLADSIAKLKRHPAFAAYFHKAGLSDADAVLIPMVCMAAAMAQMVPPAKWSQLPVSAAQIAFVQQHQKEIQALSKSASED